LLPIEILVDGTPVSHQAKSSRSRERWKKKVAASAQASVPVGATPIATEVSVSITYFYETEAPDVDNIIKPIQDALNGIVYVDDTQVAHTESKKSRIDGAFKIAGLSEDLAVRLARGRDFVRIHVSDGPNHEEIR
jgi:crossover junction endodeoxyribonuclease RusA